MFLVVKCDSKLTWAKYISIQTNNALHAIKLIRNYFSHDEILSLLRLHVYSIIFYNPEVWHFLSLKPELKQILLSTSASLLKVSQINPQRYELYVNIHTACKRAKPKQFIVYKHSILLHKLYNTKLSQMDWFDLKLNRASTTRQTIFRTIKSNNYMTGNNLLSSRLSILKLSQGKSR